MNLFYWFRKRPKVNIAELGVIPDPRPTEEKRLDYKAEEIFEFAPFEWREKLESEWRKYPIFDQDFSSSCLANAIAKALGIENVLEEGKFIFFSPRDIYTRRKNYPGRGMWFQDGCDIGYRHGATLETLMPSMGKGEEEMNKFDDRKSIDIQIALVGKAGNYFTKNPNIEEIASIIEPTGKAVVIGVKFGPNEWSRDVPIILGQNTPYHHAITGTNATLHKGQKALIIEDSWGPNTGIEGRRILTEDWFLNNRVTWSGYFGELKNTWRDTELVVPKPKYNFQKDLRYGMFEYDVERLQEILKYEELFPQNGMTTGYYGPITAKGVYEYQIKYKVAPIAEIEELKGMIVGPKTREDLNRRFS